MMVQLPARAALLVIDVQRGFYDQKWGLRNNPDAEAKIARLIEAWREMGQTIIHVHHQSLSPAGSFRTGTPGHLPKPEAAPREGEAVYRKTVNSAFIGTALEADLRAAQIETLVVVGLTTNHCVSTTVRMAGNLGFETFLVPDATAAFDRMGLDGRVRPAEEVHASALSDLHGEFATLVGTDELLGAVRSRAA